MERPRRDPRTRIAMMTSSLPHACLRKSSRSRDYYFGLDMTIWEPLSHVMTFACKTPMWHMVVYGPIGLLTKRPTRHKARTALVMNCDVILSEPWLISFCFAATSRPPNGRDACVSDCVSFREAPKLLHDMLSTSNSSTSLPDQSQ